MATKIGPKTVSQRDRSKALVFCLDAAHSDSYGGEPTTNLCANSSFGTNGDVALTSNVTVRGQSFTRKCVNNSSSSSTPGCWPIDSTITVSQSTQYTFSLRGFSNTTTGGGNAYLYVLNQSAGSDLVWSTAIGAFPTEDQYFANPANEIVSHTFTTPSGCTQLKIGVLFTGHSTTPGGIFYIKNVQLEAKSAPTPFVLGSRTASNAVENISGVGAQGTTLTGTFAAYGQQLFKPTIRNVLATFDSKKGHIGGAYWDLDGTDENIDCGAVDLGSVGTLLCWFKTGTQQSNKYLVTQGKNLTGNNGFDLTFQNTQIGSYCATVGGGGSNALYTINYYDGNWHMVLASYDGTNNRLYYDGELVVTGSSSTGGLDIEATNLLRIGSWVNSPASSFADAQIAKVMAWSSHLTAKEIKDIYIAQKGRFGK